MAISKHELDMSPRTRPGIDALPRLLLHALTVSEHLLQAGHGTLTGRMGGQANTSLYQLAHDLHSQMGRIFQGDLHLIQPLGLLQYLGKSQSSLTGTMPYQ